MEEKSLKRILLCLYSFPPIGGPRSIRWMNLLKSLQKVGFEIGVLTVKPSIHDSYYDRSLMDKLPSDVEVIRTFPGVYYSLLHRKKQPVQGFSKTTWEWLPFGWIRGLRLMKKRKYDLIISSGLPFVGHMVGYLLKQRSGVTWIADYGDSLGFNPMTSPVKRFIGKYIEGYILKKVDGITVPFEEMRGEFTKFYPFLERKDSRAIGNGIPDDYDTLGALDLDDKFIISYVGSFYKGVHDPAKFFQALQDLKNDEKVKNDIKVVVAGNTEKYFVDYAHELKLISFMNFLGQVSYSKAISLMKGSSVILYIGGKRSDYHFPYKILECAASGSPIIAIQQSPRDLGSAFIEKHHLGIVVSNKKDEITRVIRHLYELWKSQRLKESFDQIPKERFYWSRRADEMGEFILSVLDKSRNEE